MSKTNPLREEPAVRMERFVQIAVAILVVAIALLIWGMVERAEASQRSATVIQLTDDESGGAEYEVRSEDGKLTILENGKPMPEDRILRKGKTLILLDEEGRAVFQALVGENGEIEYSENLRGSMRIPRVPRPLDIPRSPSLHIGVSAQRIDGALAAQLGLERGQGITLSRVFEDSPASKAGLQRYDIITEIDGEAVGSVGELRKKLRDMEEGQSMTLTVIREGKSRKVEVTPELRSGERVLFIGEAPEIGDPPAPPSFYRFDSDGDWTVQLDELNDAPGSVRFFGDDEGVAVLAPGMALEKYQAELQTREEQLQKMEERLAKLEKMLEELLEQQKR